MQKAFKLFIRRGWVPFLVVILIKFIIDNFKNFF
jgi:hypothetical protein